MLLKQEVTSSAICSLLVHSSILDAVARMPKQ